MTLERVVSVTTFSNDNKVTTRLDRRPTFIEDDRGYQTISTPTRHEKTKENRGQSYSKRAVGYGSQEVLSRSAPQHHSVLKASSSNKAISLTSGPPTKDWHHRRKRTISHGVSVPLCDSNFNSSTNVALSASDIQADWNHQTPKSRYKKHKCAKHSSKNQRELVDFHSVHKSLSESAICPKNDSDYRNNFMNLYDRDLNEDVTQSCYSLGGGKQSTGCALSSIIPWSHKTSRDRRERLQSGNSRGRSSGNHNKSSSSIRKSHSFSNHMFSSRASSSRDNLEHDLTSPVSNPDKPTFHLTDKDDGGDDEAQGGEQSYLPLSPTSAQSCPRLSSSSKGEEGHHGHRQQQQSQGRTVSKHRSKSTKVTTRDKSEDASCKDHDYEDVDTTKSLGESRSHDSSNRLYESRSNHRSRAYNKTESSAVPSSRGSSGKSKSQQRKTDKTELEEGSQHQSTGSSSDRVSKNARSKSVDMGRKLCVGKYNPDADLKVITDAEDFEVRPTDMTGPLRLSFCGCGFQGMYHLGVVSSLIKRSPSFLSRVEKFGGTSAGSLIAALLVTSRNNLEECSKHLQALFKEIRSKPLGALTPGYSLAKNLRYMLDDVLSENAHMEATGRLYVSLTNGTTKKNEIWSEFNSRDELIEVLVASCYIPIPSGSKSKLPLIRGERYMDGGLTNNLITFRSGRTITVSPFDTKADIGPKAGSEDSKKPNFIHPNKQSTQNMKRGAHWFFPPRKSILQDYIDQGRYDASRFITKEGMYEIRVPKYITPRVVMHESTV